MPSPLIVTVALFALAAAARPAFAVCGDRHLDPGEQCDDGNTIAGDCCSPTCRYEPAGSPCNDNSVCTTSDACDGAGVCRGVKISCEEGNKCTIDHCEPADGCHHDPVSFTNTLTFMSMTLVTDACATEKVPRVVRKRFEKAVRFVAHAESAGPLKRRRLLVKKATKQLRAANGEVHRARRRLASACSDQLEARVTTARARAECLLAALLPGSAHVPVGTSRASSHVLVPRGQRHGPRDG